jgi:hypothetical protein
MKDQIVKAIAAYLKNHSIAPIVEPKQLPQYGDPEFDLWKHMADEHGVTLLETEIGDIIQLAKRVLEKEQKTGWEDVPEWANWRIEYSDGERAFSKGYPSYITTEVFKVERRPK